MSCEAFAAVEDWKNGRNRIRHRLVSKILGKKRFEEKMTTDGTNNHG